MCVMFIIIFYAYGDALNAVKFSAGRGTEDTGPRPVMMETRAWCMRENTFSALDVSNNFPSNGKTFRVGKVRL